MGVEVLAAQAGEASVYIYQPGLLLFEKAHTACLLIVLWLTL
jgi:hypothetical protein